MTEPGWYTNPENLNENRYWDGQTWSNYTTPKTNHTIQQPTTHTRKPNPNPITPDWERPPLLMRIFKTSIGIGMVAFFLLGAIRVLAPQPHPQWVTVTSLIIGYTWLAALLGTAATAITYIFKPPKHTSTTIFSMIILVASILPLPFWFWLTQ